MCKQKDIKNLLNTLCTQTHMELLSSRPNSRLPSVRVTLDNGSIIDETGAGADYNHPHWQRNLQNFDRNLQAFNQNHQLFINNSPVSTRRSTMRERKQPLTSSERAKRKKILERYVARMRPSGMLEIVQYLW